MIDLHCHILPGIDDGAPDLNASLAMAEVAVANGITHLLCTPHHNNGKYLNPKNQIIGHVAELQKELDDRQIPLTLFEGQEVRITGELLDCWDRGELLTVDVANRYLLVEFPSHDVPSYTDQIFFELFSRGVTPIIVHPERNSVFIEEPNKLIPYLEMGVLAQLTAPSYVGTFGKKIQKTAHLMVKHNLVQMVATDAHNISSRTFLLKEAYDLIAKDFGAGKAESFQEVNRGIINGDEVAVAPYSYAVKGLLNSWK